MTSLTVGIILAGGVGSRFGLGTPKQLIPVSGKTILEHTVGVFDSCDDIDEIIVMLEGEFFEVAVDVIRGGGFSKVSRMIRGGVTRSETSKLALGAVGGGDVKVVIHDAVRPLVDCRIISDCVASLDKYDAVYTAIFSADTIIEVSDGGTVGGIPDRSLLRRGQTPQAFRKSVLEEAYRLSDLDPDFGATDDCSVVLKYCPDVDIGIVDGSESNIKITYPVDIHVADKLFQLRSSEVVMGDGFEQRLNLDLCDKVVVVFGGSSGIGREMVDYARGVGARCFVYSRSLSGVDVSSRDDVRRALADAASHFGRIDYVVLSAGVLEVKPLVEVSDVELLESVGTNFMAAFLVAQESYRYLSDVQGGLLFFGSSFYTRGRANCSTYSASKAGLVNLVQALAEEWGDVSVRVNCVSPGSTAIPMRGRAFGEDSVDSLLSVGEVAVSSLAVLVSDVTGQVFDVSLSRFYPFVAGLRSV